jgi:prepilin-type N-terminal cleavage/methylation domain-containing protein
MKISNQKGFTIVELLVVIVVIGILAAITMVSYSGVTTKAKTSKAQSNANSVAQVVNIYQTDTAGGNGSFPANLAAITGYTGGIAKIPTGITVQAGTPALSATNGESTVIYVPLAVAANGGCIASWNFTNSNLDVLYVGTAATSTQSAGTLTACS